MSKELIGQSLKVPRGAEAEPHTTLASGEAHRRLHLQAALATSLLQNAKKTHSMSCPAASVSRKGPIHFMPERQGPALTTQRSSCHRGKASAKTETRTGCCPEGHLAPARRAGGTPARAFWNISHSVCASHKQYLLQQSTALL